MDPNELDLAKVEENVAKAINDEQKVALRFYEGDHWQDGAGWIGPMPKADEPGYQETRAVLEAGFVSSNKIAEVADRHAGGVVGREPQWGFTPVTPPEDEDAEPQDAEQAVIREVNAALTTWWNRRGVHETFRQAVAYAALTRRGTLRLLVPVPPEGATPATLAEALDLIYVEAPSPAHATVYEDPRTKINVGLLAVEIDGEKYGELTYLTDATDADGRRKTALKTFVGETSEEIELELGGELTMHELRVTPIVSRQVVQNQKALNLALSTVPRNVTTAGFLERILLNAQMPGKWEIDPQTQRPTRFVPEPLRMGAGTTTFVQGSEIGRDPETGKKQVATPGVVFRDPVLPDGAVASVLTHYRAILEDARQTHVLAMDKAVSARSKRESRADFMTSLRGTSPAVARAGRWMLNVALRLAEHLMAKPGAYSKTVHADLNPRLDLGPIETEEREQNRQDVEAGILPLEYAMYAAGIDDTDAATYLIQIERERAIEALQKRADILQKLTAAGLTMEVAATIAGFTDEQVQLISAIVTDPQPTDPTGGGGDAEAGEADQDVDEDVDEGDEE